MKKLFLTLLLFVVSFHSCSERLSIGKKISGTNYTFINQENVEVKLDSLLKNKITLMGFIYTNCPDICPMTTHNLFLTEMKLTSVGINNVQFILVSFDPERDTPSALNDFARIRELDLSSWTLLTGEKQVVFRFNKMMGIKAIPADSSYTDDGILNYYVIHTDRITLLDERGRIRAEYKGSTVDPQTIFEDVKYLGG